MTRAGHQNRHRCRLNDKRIRRVTSRVLRLTAASVISIATVAVMPGHVTHLIQVVIVTQ
jgi:hypothetical protein